MFQQRSYPFWRATTQKVRSKSSKENIFILMHKKQIKYNRVIKWAVAVAKQYSNLEYVFNLNLIHGFLLFKGNE